MKQTTFEGGYEREVSHPQLVWPRRCKPSLHAIQRLFEQLVGDGRACSSAAHDASEAFLTHQSLNCAAGHGNVLSLPPHFACAISPEVLLPHTPNRATQFGITPETQGNALRITLRALCS
jgi:hypothetical protein